MVRSVSFGSATSTAHTASSPGAACHAVRPGRSYRRREWHGKGRGQLVNGEGVGVEERTRRDGETAYEPVGAAVGECRGRHAERSRRRRGPELVAEFAGYMRARRGV